MTKYVHFRCLTASNDLFQSAGSDSYRVAQLWLAALSTGNRGLLKKVNTSSEKLKTTHAVHTWRALSYGRRTGIVSSPYAIAHLLNAALSGAERTNRRVARTDIGPVDRAGVGLPRSAVSSENGQVSCIPRDAHDVSVSLAHGQPSGLDHTSAPAAPGRRGFYRREHTAGRTGLYRCGGPEWRPAARLSRRLNSTLAQCHLRLLNVECLP